MTPCDLSYDKSYRIVYFPMKNLSALSESVFVNRWIARKYFLVNKIFTLVVILYYSGRQSVSLTNFFLLYFFSDLSKVCLPGGRGPGGPGEEEEELLKIKSFKFFI